MCNIDILWNKRSNVPGAIDGDNGDLLIIKANWID